MMPPAKIHNNIQICNIFGTVQMGHVFRLINVAAVNDNICFAIYKGSNIICPGGDNCIENNIWMRQRIISD